MARNSKKPKDFEDFQPDSINDEYEAYLLKRKKELQKQMDQFQDRASREVVEVGLWGVLGGIGMAFDFALLGGLGTGLAVASGALWARYGIGKKRVKKELKKVEEKLREYQELKSVLKPDEPPANSLSKSITDDFTTSAAPETEADIIKKKLAELEKKMEDMQNPKPAKLDKDTFKKPEDRP